MPIPAVAVRELVYDEHGDVVKPEATNSRRRRPPSEAQNPTGELQPGQTRRETEGVFVVRDGRATFVPIRLGVAGDRYFEVLGGIEAGDEVITGPYNSVRGMADGDLVKVDNSSK